MIEQLGAILSANTVLGTSWETDEGAGYSSKFYYYKRSDGLATATVSRTYGLNARRHNDAG
jgi:hypothetical protein